MSRSLLNFVPVPFVDFLDMQRAAYAHIFPRTDQDKELQEILQAAMDAQQVELNKIERRGFDALPDDVRQSVGVLQETELLQNRMAEITGDAPPNQPPDAAMVLQRFTEMVSVKLEFMAARCDQLRCSDCAPLDAVIANGQVRGGLSPAENELGHERLARLNRHILKILAAGKLTPHYMDPDQGITPFPNRHIWLDPQVAREALVTGMADPQGGHQQADKWQMVFTSEEVEALFQPLSKAPKQTSKMLSIDVAETFIRDNYPEFTAPDWNLPRTNPEVMAAIEAETGTTLSLSTLQNAKRRIKGA